MYFASEGKQGEKQLPGGETTYNQMSLAYNFVSWFCGLGLTYQSDQLGEVQKNTGIGLKLELNFNGLYLEYGYGSVSQTFSGRAVKTRSGSQTSKAAGLRVPFVANIVFFDGGIRQRTTTLTKQDGADLKESVVESMTMPYVGIGIYL